MKYLLTVEAHQPVPFAEPGVVGGAPRVDDLKMNRLTALDHEACRANPSEAHTRTSAVLSTRILQAILNIDIIYDIYINHRL